MNRATFVATTAAAAVHPYTVPFSEVRELRSRINGVRYLLDVRLPRSYGTGTQRYPVVLALDADYAFAVAANVCDKLAARDQVREAIVVAAGYPGYPDERAYRLNRTRDYTPWFVATGGYGPEYQRLSGGGRAFATVIATEILPLIDRAYRTQSSGRTFVGHSYGGLFGTYLLATRPPLFANYLLVSPSLWYDGRRTLADARAPAVPRTAGPTQVYLAVGGLEGENDGRSMAGDLRDYAAILRGRQDPGLSVELRVFEDETHDSVFPAAFTNGVRHLLSTDRNGTGG